MSFRSKSRLPIDFHASEYLIINDDVRQSGEDAEKHYLKFGSREGRKYKLSQLVPPDFVAEEYKLLNPDIIHSKVLPEIHYYYHGQNEGRRYRLARAKADDSFDPHWYVSEYPEILEYTTDPQAHYLQTGRYEGRHPFFNDSWYRAEYEEYLQDWEFTALEHYLSVGKNECFHPNFDPIWYLTNNSDVATADIDPLFHYQRLGRREGRDPAFSRTWYTKQYREFLNKNVDAFYHYMSVGRQSGLFPAIHHHWYVVEYPDIQSTNLHPYAHYEKYGKEVGYKPSPINSKRRYFARISNFPPAYDAKYEPKEAYDVRRLDVKAIAFYLPQFHRIRENDQWWGNGFTEWTNTKQAKPLFNDHYQPRNPHKEISYYDLSDPDTLRRQSELAKEFGMYAFCFYYYWFSGKKLLEKPLENLLNNPDINQKFMICWANENWTRTWDGNENDVLIRQEFKGDDPLAFIKDIEKYLVDSRYVNIGGSPVLLVYKAQLIKNTGSVFAEWRRYWTSKYSSQLLIWCVRTDLSDLNYTHLDAKFDALVEFPPHLVPRTRHLSRYYMDQDLAGIDSDANFYDYGKLVEDITQGEDYADFPAVPFYRSVMLGWDNTARRKQGSSIWYGYSLRLYEKWLKHVVDYSRKSFPEQKRFCFINAWNEWAEGTYLEPDEGTGYAALNATARVLSNSERANVPVPITGEKLGAGMSPLKILIHVHVFYTEDFAPLLEVFKKSEISFDLIITTNADEKKTRISQMIGNCDLSARTFIKVCDNIGRDVGPVLLNLSDVILKYHIFGHFHTKRSPTVDWGRLWCEFLWRNLVGSPEHLGRIVNEFAVRHKIGIIKAPAYPLIAPHVSWGGVKERCYSILSKVGISVRLPQNLSFPVGNMFWARTSAIEPLLKHSWHASDFEIENDQISGTLAHCVERLWEYVAASQDYETVEIVNPGEKKNAIKALNACRRLCIYVHYNANGRILDCDLEFLRQCKPHFADLFVVSNSGVSENDLRRLNLYATGVLQRENRGLDFAAWRDAIRTIGWNDLKSYDELVLANNSCYGPVRPLDHLFDSMQSAQVDFWGITSFPKIVDSNRPEVARLKNRTIERHLQSYWIAFRNKVVNSVEFYRFFEEIEDKATLSDVVVSYEARLTKTLSDSGFSWAAYVPDAEFMQKERAGDPRYNAPYNNPYELLLLGSPFIKKHSPDYDRDNAHLARKFCSAIGNFPAHLIDLREG